MRIGTEFAGKVDAVGPESIQTKFLVVGGPIVPLKSFYVLQETGRGVNGFPIPLHAKSVLFGYLRNWLFIPAFVFLVLGFAIRDELAWMIVPGFVLTAAWLVCWLALGKPSASDRKKRETLGRLVGLRAPPSMVPMDVAQKIVAALRARLTEAGLTAEVGALAGTAHGPMLSVAWAYAWYSGRNDVADELWSVLDGTGAIAPPGARPPSATIDPPSAAAITPR